MKNILYDDWMKIALPENWEAEEDHNNALLNIYSHQGKGVLQISFVTRTKIDGHLKDDLMDQLELHIARKKPRSILVLPRIKEEKNYLIGCLEYILDNRYWRVFVLINEMKLLFITYNCDEIDKEEELAEINSIISSIIFLGKSTRSS